MVGLQAGDRVGRARPRLQALLPDPAQRPRPLHRDRPRRATPRASLSQYRATHLGDDEPGEVDAVNGAFMLCRAEAVREVGLLDEGYWLYMEDLDWCRRFWQAGWKVFYEPAGVALHVKGGSSGKRRAPQTGDRLPPRHGPLLPPLRRRRAQPAAQRRRLRRHRRQAGDQPRRSHAVPRPLRTGSVSATSASVGAVLSRSESSGSATGHSTPTSGSSQAMPDSVAGS